MESINCGFFVHYDNPLRARKIADEYISEPINMSVKFIAAIGDAIVGHNKCDDLDYFLYNLFLQNGASLCPNPNPEGKNKRPIDEEKGIESIARKRYEETTCHGCF